MVSRWSDVALSPDGKQLATLDNVGLSLLDLTTRISTPLLSSDQAGLKLTFAADGKSLYFVNHDSTQESVAVLNRYSLVTKRSIRLLTGLDGGIAVSPDGQRIAFVRRGPDNEATLMVADADGRGERRLVSVHAGSCRAWFPEPERAAIEIIGVGLRHMYERQLIAVSTRTGERKDFPTLRGVMKMIWPTAASFFVLEPQPWKGQGLIYGHVWHRDSPQAGGVQLTRDPSEFSDVLGASADGSIMLVTRPVFRTVTLEGMIEAAASLLLPNRRFAYPREVIRYEIAVLKRPS